MSLRHKRAGGAQLSSVCGRSTNLCEFSFAFYLAVSLNIFWTSSFFVAWRVVAAVCLYFLIFTFVSTSISSLRVRKLLEVGLFKSNCHAFDLQLYLSVLCSSSFILVSLHSVIRCTLVYSRGAGYSSSFFCLKFAVTFLFLYFAVANFFWSDRICCCLQIIAVVRLYSKFAYPLLIYLNTYAYI